MRITMTVIVCVFFSITVAMAGETSLAFPQTEDEIIKIYTSGQTNTRGLSKTRGFVAKGRGVEGIRKAPKAGVLVQFAVDSAVIRPNSYRILDEFVKALKGGLWDMRFKVAGHTDSQGSDEYNYRLSERRAASVVRYLTAGGITRDRLVSEGHGEIAPIATNRTAYGRQQNRRVEFILLGRN